MVTPSRPTRHASRHLSEAERRLEYRSAVGLVLLLLLLNPSKKRLEVSGDSQCTCVRDTPATIPQKAMK